MYMRMNELIIKKRNGEFLTKDEIYFIVNGYTNNEIADYQMAAFLMAVYFQGMNIEETVHLTMAMAESGEMLDLSGIEGKKADKHSTGGVGDKTTLIVAPMVAALGVPVAKLSGRGLSHTGGTIDKLESFKGFKAELPIEKFIENVNIMKLSLIGQTKELAPADKKIYALRDVTGTVEQVSLIAGSIMSKKIAAGADVIVLDVKTGSGAFMKTMEDSLQLAELMADIGNNIGRTTYAVISDMNQPLGHAVGNTLEVIEAVQTLNGEGPEDLLEVSLMLASYMLIGTGSAADEEDARKKLLETIDNKTALNKLAEFIREQGGEADAVYNTELFDKANIIQDVYTDKEGYITKINTDEIGMAAMMLGGGRETKESIIDLSVGIILNKKLGDKVDHGTPLASIHANDINKLDAARKRLLGALTIEDKKAEVPKRIYGIVNRESCMKKAISHF